MHKRFVNQAEIDFTLAPDGPILVKAGESGLDPTRPDMEFVRTFHDGRETIYLPGSSLKGVLRSYCEKIARTLQSDEALQVLEKRLTCNPLKDDHTAQDGSCSAKLNQLKRERGRELASHEIYRKSCFVCQMFGNTALASHVRLSDAYPILPEGYDELDEETKRQVNPNFTEERDGVAIDRVYGSVAVGPFQFEVATRGRFAGKISMRNFTLAQLGLLAVALRDLVDGHVSLGFGKSRGLGAVEAEIDRLRLRYPFGQLQGVETGALVGVGALVPEQDGYGLRPSDRAKLSELAYETEDWGDMTATMSGGERGQPLHNLLSTCVGHWTEVVRHGR